MTIVHRAYTFDQQNFHRRLEQKVIVNGSLDLVMFQKFAKEVVKNADEETMEALQNLRFDEEWLDNPEDIWSGDEWYVIALAESLTKAPSLSKRLLGSYRVLEMTLAIIGWSSQDITTLLTGANLSSLISASFCRPLMLAFRGSIQYGGWISNDIVKRLLGLLQETMSNKERLSATLVGAITDYCKMIGIEPESALNSAYADAEEMLNTATGKKDDLLVLLYD